MSTSPTTALDRARRKAYIRLLPLLFVSYAIAYVDRINVSLAKLKMSKDLPGFNNEVIGFGAGVFFIGYFLLEIPGTLLVEKWSARKWISRIMISWGIVAAMTAFIHYRVPGVTGLAELAVGGIATMFEPLAHSNLGWLSRQSQLIVESLRGPDSPFILQFFSIRFLLGLAEAGFFPGVIVYLTHWFPARDRARALSWFFIATPVAQFVSPKLSYYLLQNRHYRDLWQRGHPSPGASGNAGLAVDVHRLGHSGGDSRDSGAFASARLAQRGTLADAR